MLRQRIKTVLQEAEPNKPVTINAWVKTKRKSKKFAFMVVNDGSTQSDLQIIIDAGLEAFETLDQVSTGAAVRVDGTLVSSPGKGQQW